jgi:glycine/D-amino acid oxidase-like deaminating enzyme
VLLAPRTGQLIADVVEGKPGSDLLEHFSWTRFLPGGKAAAPRR